MLRELEKIIRDNIQEFNRQEPEKGHFDRFRQKMKKAGIPRIRKNGWIKIAAAAVVTVMAGIGVHELIRNTTLKNMRFGAGGIPEYREVEMYFSGQVNKRYQQIKKLDFDDPQQKKMILRELKEIDQLSEGLQEDMKANPYDERVIGAMIRHYQTKLEIMNTILDQLSCIQNSNKNNHHESKDI